ncbi:MAG: toll/interleukin-1 receptor domain-containing protein [Pseudomonadota bacterium]
MADVFISYARSERPKAEAIKDLLEAAGLSVFFDVQGLDGGDVFPDVLDREVKSAGAVLGLWSPHALSRPWVKIECLIGKDRGVLVPASIEPINALIDLPAAFYGVQHVDLSDFHGDPSDANWLALLRSLGRTLGRPDLARQAAAPPPGDAAGEADLRAQMERMRDELNALRGTLSETPAPPAAQRQPEPQPKPEPGTQAAPVAPTAPAPASAYAEDLSAPRASLPASIALVAAGLACAFRLDLTDWLAWELSPGAPLIALVAAATAGKGARYLLAGIFAASIVQFPISYGFRLGSSEPGLSVLAALICVFDWRALVAKAALWPVALASLVLAAAAGNVAVGAFSYVTGAEWQLFGAAYLTLAVITLASGARGPARAVGVAALAFGLIVLLEWSGLWMEVFAFDVIDTEVFVQPYRLRLGVTSAVSIALASLAVWTLVRPVPGPPVRLALGLCLACFVWCHFTPLGAGELDRLFAALEPRAQAQLATPPQQSVIVVTGSRVNAFSLNIVAALAAGLLWGREMAAQAWRAFGVPAIMAGLAAALALLLTGYPTANLAFGLWTLVAVWVGRSGFMGTAGTGSRP